MWQSRLARCIVAPVVLPHELGHALPATVARLRSTVTLLPDWDGSQQPLGRFNAELTPSTPLWVIRLVALAPAPIFIAVAVGIRLTLSPSGPGAVATVLCCSLWAAPSGGDLAVAREPAQARAAGEFLVTTAGEERLLSDLMSVTVTAVVGAVLLA